MRFWETRYCRTGDWGQECSSLARSTNLEIFLIQRPQQFFLSFNSKADAIFLGQVIPAFPKSLTSDSRMPLQIQIYMVGKLVFVKFDNDNSSQL